MFRLTVEMVISRGRDSAVIAIGPILDGRVERGDLLVVPRGPREFPSLARVRQIDARGNLRST